MKKKWWIVLVVVILLVVGCGIAWYLLYENELGPKCDLERCFKIPGGKKICPC